MLKPTYAFTLHLSAKHERAHLIRREEREIPDNAWQQLADNMANDPAVVPIRPCVLAARWQQNMMAVVLHEGRIISCVSLIPLYHEAMRRQLETILERPLLDTIEVYEVMSLWTAPDWRHNGIAQALLQQFYAASLSSNTLLISVCIGLGAGYVLAKLGWRLIGWESLPFLTSCIGWMLEENNSFYNVRRAQFIATRGKRKRYNGRHIPLCEFEQHRWEDYYHVWVSDSEGAEKLNTHIAEVLNGQLSVWRYAVQVMSQRTNTHKHAA